MKKIVFICFMFLGVFIVSFVEAKAQLENRKDCGKSEDDECFHTSLTIAARRGDLEKVRSLLIKGSFVDERNYFKRTALKEAIISKRREIVNTLIEAGADVNDKADDYTPLGLALTASSEDIFKDLIFAGANYSERFANGKTLLIAAAGLGRKEIIRVLLFFGEDINATDNNGTNALMNAILNSYPPNLGSIKLLISKEIHKNAVNHEGLTALDYAEKALKEYKNNQQGIEAYSRVIKILQDEASIE